MNLKHLSLLKISGEDASDFLQGQLTNDVDLLEGRWQLSGYCNPKGRLLALLYLWRNNQDFYVLISSDLEEAVSKRLRMYVMRSKVIIEGTPQAQIIGFESLNKLTEFSAGDANNDNVSKALVNQATMGASQVSENGQEQNKKFCYLDEKASVLQLNQRFIAVLHSPTTEALTASSSSSNDTDWIKLDIEEGIPQINSHSSELFIPQMLNLDVLDGINFKKGCYTGQEIVARMHYLGKLKQRMFLCDVEKHSNEFAVIAGDKIFSDPSLEKAVGNIVSCHPDNGANLSLLAVLRLEAIEQPLYLVDGTEIKVKAQQPYVI